MTSIIGMLITTSHSVDGKVVAANRGVVAAEVVFGANFLRDFAASLTDSIGGRSASYEKVFEGARQTALDTLSQNAQALGADAVIGLRLAYQVLGERNGMMMVAAYGTAVTLGKSEEERAKDEKRAAAQLAEYFININGTERGPFSIDQLRELMQAGHIGMASTARADGECPMLVRDLLV